MKACKSMQEMIMRLARQHGVDLSKVGAHFRLEMLGYDPLSVENVGCNMISVAHFFLQNGDVMYDPEMVFLLYNGGWVPYSITQAPMGGYREVIVLDDAGNPSRYSQRGMNELWRFAGMWARNIAEQGWLTGASCTRKQEGEE